MEHTSVVRLTKMKYPIEAIYEYRVNGLIRLLWFD
jgi:hypothetical protein